MSMSTFLNLIRKADDRYRELYAVWQACEAAGVNPPTEITDYFGEGDLADVDPAGFPTQTIYGYSDDLPPGVTKVQPHAMAVGWEIDLDLLDPSVRLIRFYNSW